MALPSAKRKVRCREIAADDLASVAALLTIGFHGRPQSYWRRGLERQAKRAVPASYPRFGYLLEADGRAVGVILLLFSEKTAGGETCIICNVSSWYVEPEFRSQGALLTAMALKHKQVTYINVTPAPATWPIVEAQGFKRYCSGLFVAIPALSRQADVSLQIIERDAVKPDDLGDAEFDMLVRHAGYGCISLVARTAESTMPFVLAPFRARRGRLALPAMQLAYCRAIADFVTCAGAIGRHLLMRGKVFVPIDANGPIAGLSGFYTEKRGRKYFRGPHPPALADLTETELVLYGM